jgi:hypothetical protein
VQAAEGSAMALLCLQADVCCRPEGEEEEEEGAACRCARPSAALLLLPLPLLSPSSSLWREAGEEASRTVMRRRKLPQTQTRWQQSLRLPPPTQQVRCSNTTVTVPCQIWSGAHSGDLASAVGVTVKRQQQQHLYHLVSKPRSQRGLLLGLLLLLSSETALHVSSLLCFHRLPHAALAARVPSVPALQPWKLLLTMEDVGEEEEELKGALLQELCFLRDLVLRGA